MSTTHTANLGGLIKAAMHASLMNNEVEREMGVFVDRLVAIASQATTQALSSGDAGAEPKAWMHEDGERVISAGQKAQALQDGGASASSVSGYTVRLFGDASAGEVPNGFALVPIRLTRAMKEALAEEDWEWRDVLVAAEAISEEDYNAVETDALSGKELFWAWWNHYAVQDVEFNFPVWADQSEALKAAWNETAASLPQVREQAALPANWQKLIDMIENGVCAGESSYADGVNIAVRNAVQMVRVFAAEHAKPPAGLAINEHSVSALRWLLNLTTEFDRKDVRTRQAARLLDEYGSGDPYRTNREWLEALWKSIKTAPAHGAASPAGDALSSDLILRSEAPTQ